VIEQPYAYRRTELAEPDWTRFPGWAGVTRDEWESVQWQRAHCVKNLRQLREVLGTGLSEAFCTDLEADQRERATMSMLVPPQMVNTMAPGVAPDESGFTDAFYADPVRRYMIPVFSDRRPDWPSHPYATRDSLHEAEMWAVEGLTHRYPTKVLAEVLPTCPQYCGHCTRMDLVGNPTPVTVKHKFAAPREDRLAAMITYLKSTPGVRDVVVSGGDVANLPWPRLEAFVSALLDVDNIRDIRLATKALMGLPQHWLSDEVRAGMERLGATARERGVSIAIHTHVNAAQSVTPLVARAARAMLDTGIRDVRNQGVEAQALQHQIMGYLPGFATPRIVCDVPYVGKRWVHQVSRYDTRLGISYWTKNYRTGVEADDPLALSREYAYYDPIYTLPAEGQQWWLDRSRTEATASLTPAG
jgi:lysine 2,3-aminomutase